MEGYGQKSTNGTGIGGNGTVNFLAKFTPNSRNGTTIGDSQIFDDGTFVGINTTDPLGKLHIFGADNPTRLIIDAQNASNAKILSFRTNGSPRWAIRVESPGGSTSDNLEVRAYNNSGDLVHTPIHITRNTGFVGININVPLAQSHIKGSGNTSGTTAFRVDSSTVNNLLTIKDDGLVGIGTDSPSNKLYIHAASNQGIGIFNGTHTVNILPSGTSALTELNTTNIGHQFNSADGYHRIGRTSSGVALIYVANAATALQLSGAVSGTPHIHITSTGNIGIDTVSPTSKLQVVGLPTYADNASALSGGLTAGALYIRTGHGLDIVI